MGHQILLILLSRRKNLNISQTNIQMREVRAERAEKGSRKSGSSPEVHIFNAFKKGKWIATTADLDQGE